MSKKVKKLCNEKIQPRLQIQKYNFRSQDVYIIREKLTGTQNVGVFLLRHILQK